jgi:hypothetical protein
VSDSLLEGCRFPFKASRVDFGESITRHGRRGQNFVDLERKVFDAVIQFLFDGGTTVIHPFMDRQKPSLTPECT